MPPLKKCLVVAQFIEQIRNFNYLARLPVSGMVNQVTTGFFTNFIIYNLSEEVKLT